VSWERPFDQPIPLPSGPPARTLRDAADYIRKLSASERDTREWRLAIQMLIDAAEDRGPMLFARVSIGPSTETSSACSIPIARIRIGEAEAGARSMSSRVGSNARCVVWATLVGFPPPNSSYDSTIGVSNA
jgi:hypothetical protein